jgi:acetyl esterase/lipase
MTRLSQHPGFIGGNNDQFANIGRALVKLFNATVASISYRHAPEFKKSQQAYDTWDNMKWIADNATGDILKADPSKGFLMGGMSAGACLTIVLSRKFQEEKLSHPLTGQWLAACPTSE